MYGLKPLQPDQRDFNLGSLYDLPSLDELPDEFILETLNIKDQGDTDFCTAYSSTTISELQEYVELSPEWVFATGKMIDGDVDSWGMDLRTVCKVHQKYGAIEQKDAPFSLKNKTADFLRQIKNWPEDLFNKAVYHVKKTYVKVNGPYDSFDNIKASIWKFRNEARGVAIGINWSWPNSEKFLEKPGEGIGHAVAVIGWTGDYLIIQNSYGQEAGDNGKHYISREVINKFVPYYGAFMFVDISKEQALSYINNGYKADWFWLYNIYYYLKNRLKKKITKQEQLLKLAISRLDTDFTPDYPVPDELSCALAVTTLLKEVDPSHHIITGTWALDDYFRFNPQKFKRNPEPVKKIKAGSIVISPTGQGNDMIRGHVGIYLNDYDIMSNDSYTGLWKTNFNRDTWRNRYYYKGALPVRIYELL